ncbi:hypothetical protein WOLCODRAFT_156057 [Wolfiporia cocos MD-104 SS10]|uniref:Uncharacterized protein n=1 Tax=Wolfiporia cocos (strain MD-104) TaxID=742152 RepID=A0A2H3J0Y9_WOLCO|nr:hypothetical protein WOLCODRAFT_156057 [Wolfiporia cocos MD-104 SS10]
MPTQWDFDAAPCRPIPTTKRSCFSRGNPFVRTSATWSPVAYPNVLCTLVENRVLGEHNG